MKDFIFHNPTKAYFGNYLKRLPKELSGYGKNVLLVYGGGSIKRSGLYDTVMNSLNEKRFFRFGAGRRGAKSPSQYGK